MWVFPHMFGFSHTCVVKSTYYSCVALTTQVCFIAHTCGNNQTCVENPHRQVLGFFHTCLVKHTHRLISSWANGGEHIPLHSVPIDFGISGESTEVPFLWPVTLLHHISEDSPFWEVTTTRLEAKLIWRCFQWDAEKWLSSDWEILLWINGTSSSGYVSSRTSYKSHPAIKVQIWAFVQQGWRSGLGQRVLHHISRRRHREGDQFTNHKGFALSSNQIL